MRACMCMHTHTLPTSSTDIVNISQLARAATACPTDHTVTTKFATVYRFLKICRNCVVYIYNKGKLTWENITKILLSPSRYTKYQVTPFCSVTNVWCITCICGQGGGCGGTKPLSTHPWLYVSLSTFQKQKNMQEKKGEGKIKIQPTVSI